MDENIDSSPEELRQQVSNAQLSFLPDKSRDKYLKCLDIFNQWRISQHARTFSETVLLSYFIHLSETKQPSTMWSIYSMLKATIKTKYDVHIEKYPKLIAFLKRKAVGHQSKKPKVFTALHIENFLNEAPDCNFLAAKAIIIVGISGACRCNELLNLTVGAIEKHSDNLLLVNLPNTKTNIDRSFVIQEEHVKIIDKYRMLRPANTKTDRFFIQYHKGKCTRQPMVINKLSSTPRDIATYLNLEEPNMYTGHAFRRTSATLLADSGADLTMLKRHGGWRSSAVAEGYIEDSLQNKDKICQRIIENINLTKSSPHAPHPSTSKGTPKTDPWSNPSTSIGSSIETDPWSRPSTSKDSTLPIGTDPWSRRSTSKDSTLPIGTDPWSRPSTSKDSTETPNARVTDSPTFTIHNNEIISQTNKVTNTTITVPNKTIHLNVTNCTNCTFHF